jgi:hypothetical protein
MNYLHVLCIIFMVLSCVLCMTLMMFIYVYYGLFVCTNLVDVMSLFFTGFSFHLSIFNKNQPVFDKNWPEIATLIFWKTDQFIKQTDRFIDKIGRFISVFGFHCFSVVSDTFRPNFSDFFKNRWNWWRPVFVVPPNFQTQSHVVLIFFQKRKAGSMKYVFLLGAMMAQDETSGETLISGK